MQCLLSMVVSLREVGMVKPQVVTVQVRVEEAKHAGVGGGGEGGAEGRVGDGRLLLHVLVLLFALLQARGSEDCRCLGWWR